MRRVLVVILFMLGLLAWPCLGLAADEQPLGEVKFANPDQQAVAAVILDFQKYYDTFKPDKLMSLFTNDAQLLTGMKGNRKGTWVTKGEYEKDIVQGKMTQLATYTFELTFYKPTMLEVNNKAATIKLPYLSNCTHGDFWENGSFEFEFVKVGDKWLIKKLSWKVTDTHKSMDWSISDQESVVF